MTKEQMIKKLQQEEAQAHDLWVFSSDNNSVDKDEYLDKWLYISRILEDLEIEPNINLREIK